MPSAPSAGPCLQATRQVRADKAVVPFSDAVIKKLSEDQPEMPVSPWSPWTNLHGQAEHICAAPGKNGGGLARVHCMGDLNGSSFSDNSGLSGGSVYIDGCVADNLYSNEFVNGNVSAFSCEDRRINSLRV